MRVQPIGVSASRLLISQWSTLYTPRILRWGVAQSLLAARLRMRNGYLFTAVPGSTCSFILPPIYPFDVSPPEEGQPIKPLDLVWPYELPPPGEEILFVEETVERPHYHPGSYLDLLT